MGAPIVGAEKLGSAWLSAQNVQSQRFPQVRRQWLNSAPSEAKISHEVAWMWVKIITELVSGAAHTGFPAQFHEFSLPEYLATPSHCGGSFSPCILTHARMKFLREVGVELSRLPARRLEIAGASAFEASTVGNQLFAAGEVSG